jgi:hypothetical protein
VLELLELLTLEHPCVVLVIVLDNVEARKETGAVETVEIGAVETGVVDAATVEAKLVSVGET